MKLSYIIGLLVVFVFFLAAVYRVIFYKPPAEPSEQQLQLMQKLDAYVFTSPTLDRELPYRLFQPKPLSEHMAYPLIVLLHASGGRGDNNFSQLDESVERLTSSELQNIEPAYVVVPQCPTGMEWTQNAVQSGPPFVNYRMSDYPTSWRQQVLVELITDLQRRFAIDAKRIYLTGMSMGGTATWDTLFRYPGLFAAAVPLNGRADPVAAKVIGETPLWSFHGRNDTVAPIENSRQMVAALESVGADVRFTELDAGHGIAVQSYSQMLYRWLLSQSVDQESMP